ncbi:MAG: EAL domain-containing protein [Kangiellaceae bacterium]|jgi:diguanylate cyclase (GGDEF)-like protein|nr:EAL domain-containing protein [Kangiellaceae bacterium]
MHKLLRRQIKKFLGEQADRPELKPFIDAVNQAYHSNDEDRALIERSLDLTSSELSDRNQQLRSQLKKQELSMSTLKATFDSTGEGIFSIDNDSRLVHCNRVAREILEIKDDHREFSIFFLMRRLKSLLKSDFIFSNFITEQESHQSENMLQTLEFNNGNVYEIYSSPRVSKKRMIGRVWCFRDVTHHRKSQQIIEHQAFHDALTGLPNRALLTDRLEHAISHAKRNQSLVAIVFIDLDHFKKVNDSAGHQIGDKLLIDVAQRLQSCTREEDTIARLGGDEFVILVEQTDSSNVVTHLAKRIIQNIQLPFEINNTNYFIGCSIGISMYPSDGKTSDELLRKADMSMYHAKDSGRVNFQYFDESLERLALHHLNIENQLRLAVANNELSMVYQPKIHLASGNISSAEALLRWQSKGKFISPTEFIPIAEQSGLINDISKWVFRHVCQQISDWRESGKAKFKVAVNISSVNFNDTSFLSFVEETLTNYDISGEWLEFEITETVLLQGTTDVDTFTSKVKAMGISLSIDDFGTGYSSLSYLHKLQIDTLKIDKSFIFDLEKKENNQTITRTIIGLAKSLGLDVIAEGVETAEVKNWLLEHHCDYVQGYYYYKPLSADALIDALESEQQSKRKIV